MFEIFEGLRWEDILISVAFGFALVVILILMFGWILAKLTSDHPFYEDEEEIPDDCIKTAGGKVIKRVNAARVLTPAKTQDGKDVRVARDGTVYHRDEGGTLRRQK